MRRHLIDVWVEQSVIDDATDQWCGRLHACIQATGGHCEYSLWHLLVKTLLIVINKVKFIVKRENCFRLLLVSWHLPFTGSVAKCLRCGKIVNNFHYTLTAESNGKGNFKIVQHLAKLWARVGVLFGSCGIINVQVQPLCDSPLAAAVNTLGSSSMPENLRFSSPTRCREPLLSARSSTLCTVFSTAHIATASQHMTLIITTQLLIRRALGTVHTSHNDKVIQRSGSLSKIHSRFPCPFSASTRLIGQQEGHSAYKKPLRQSPLENLSINPPGGLRKQDYLPAI